MPAAARRVMAEGEDHRKPQRPNPQPDAALRQQLSQLLNALPAPAVHGIMREIDGVDPGKRSNGSLHRLKVVRTTLIEELNRRRPHRAQRLFMTLFEPLLVTDAVLFLAYRPIPGVFQRFDVKILWQSLTRQAFPALVDKTQALLDEHCQTMLVEEALQREDALALREEMREAACTYLDRICANNAETANLTSVLNKARGEAIAAEFPEVDRLVPLDRGYLSYVRDYLQGKAAVAPRVEKALQAFRGDPRTRNDSDKRSKALEDAVTEAQKEISAAGGNPRIGNLIPLSFLHLKQAYNLTATYILREVGTLDERDALADALMGHFTAVTKALQVRIKTALGVTDQHLARKRKPDDPPPPERVVIAMNDKESLEALLDRASRATHGVRTSKLLEHETIGRVFHFHWRELTQFLSMLVSRVLGARIKASLAAAHEPSDDHDDVIWLSRFIWRWHETARDLEEDSMFFDQWQTQVIGDVKAALDEAMRSQFMDAVGVRMGYLMRLDAMAMCVGSRVTRVISVTSDNFVHLMQQRLEAGGELSKDERFIIREAVQLAREELHKSKNWQQPNLARLVELAEANGFN